MKYEVTINGTLPTTLNNGKSKDYFTLACTCTEAMIMMYTNFAYKSVEASYVGAGDLTITIRKIIKSTEPPTVGEMEEADICFLENELFEGLIVIPFAKQEHLENPTITDVKPVLED